jgi:hypothetical protein
MRQWQSSERTMEQTSDGPLADSVDFTFWNATSISALALDHAESFAG